MPHGSRRSRMFPAVVAGVCLSVGVCTVHAQSTSESASGTTAATTSSAASSSASAGGGGSVWSQLWGDHADVNVGLGLGLDQRYMGARDYRPMIVPMFSVTRGVFLADAVKGVGVQYQSSGGFYVGDTFNYDPGRDDRNDWLRPGGDNLRNMGSVKGTVTNTVTVAQQIVPWLSVNAQAEFGLDGHRRGNQYQLGLESVAYKQGVDTLTLDLNAKIGDSQYNQTYFGVTNAQQNASGYHAYHPGFGIYAYALTATWDRKFDKHWAGELIVSGSYYPSKAAASPIVQRRFGLTILPSVSYAF
ncbi:MipA/OmpV family protein [Robbsia andropogonis]|uniref:MipA/OmpV family protein n=1 Tax=Robbsia andropogonis TaxID=28092 RepID=UPI001F48E5BA|nr:MipA/OmpV family protein [Robbsia andropogonis]